MAYTSKLEHDAVLVADMTQAIRGLRIHPETFDLGITGRGRRYTPDLYVEFVDASFAWVEVKRRDYMIENPDLRGRLGLLEAICTLRGGRFIIWTDDDIHREPRWHNARRLRAAVGHVTPDREMRIAQTCRRHGFPTPLGAIGAEAEDQLALIEAALGLCAMGRLALDLNHPIGPETLLFEGLDA